MVATGHKRVQLGSAIRHGETDCLENAGRLPATVYARSTMVTTLSPCDMCTGAILLYKIPTVIVGENRTFYGAEDLLRSRGVEVVVLDDAECVAMMTAFIADEPVAVERGHRRRGLTGGGGSSHAGRGETVAGERGVGPGRHAGDLTPEPGRRLERLGRVHRVELDLDGAQPVERPLVEVDLGLQPGMVIAEWYLIPALGDPPPCCRRPEPVGDERVDRDLSSTRCTPSPAFTVRRAWLPANRTRTVTSPSSAR